MTVKICHIADIHWRGSSRHEEYRKTYEYLINELRTLKPDIIYIGGDIVHSKTQGISPELIKYLGQWLNDLSEICPVHMILGNHDGILHNKARLDAISPIVNLLDNPEIHLFKKSGVYPTGFPGFNWCVFSCFDEDGWENVKPVPGEINLAVYHGAVWGSKSDIDWEVEGEVTVDMFEGYDFTLLGDIHRMQFLSEDKRIAYPGSVIQQNYGESQEKGFLFWTIRSKDDFDVDFHVIPGTKPFVTLNWKGSVKETIDSAKKYPKESRFRIRSADPIPQVEINQIQNSLKDLKDATEVVWKWEDGDTPNEINTESASLLKNDLRDLGVHVSLLKEFLGEDTLTADEWNNVKDMVKDYLQRALNDSDEVRNRIWSLKRLEFDNLFCYGSGNIVDFSKMKGITGIFAENAKGKSALVGAIMYALFNTSDRGSIKNHHIINERKDFCKARASVRVDSSNYKIERQTVKYEDKKGHQYGTTHLNLYKDEDGGIIDLSGEQRRQTEKSLRKLIGIADDFLLTSFASQGELNEFINEGASYRKRVLTKFLDLDIFELMYEYSREDSSIIKTQLKSAPDREWDSVIKKKEKDLKRISKKIEDKESELASKRTVLQNLQASLSSVLPDGTITRADIRRHESKISSAKNDLQGKEDFLEKIKKDILNLDKEISITEEFLSKVVIDELLEKLEEKQNIESSLISIKHRHETELTKLIQQEKSLDLLSKVPCEDRFPNCMFIKESHKVKELIGDQRELVSETLENVKALTKSIKTMSLENIEEKIEEYEGLESRKEEIDLQMSRKKVESDRASFEIESIEEKIKALNLTLEEMKSKVSDEIDEEVESLKEAIDNLSHEISAIDSDKMSSAIKSGELTAEIESLQAEKVKYGHLRSQWKIYESFNLAVSKKGIPAQIIRSQLPAINAEISKILNGVSGFTVELSSVPESNAMDIFIDYGDSKRIIELASGMEKMIGSLAIRVALLNISSLSKTDTLIIDEGFGTLDENHIEDCARLLQSLKTWFRNILVITHIDSMKDVADNVVEINSRGKDSTIVFDG